MRDLFMFHITSYALHRCGARLYRDALDISGEAFRALRSIAFHNSTHMTGKMAI